MRPSAIHYLTALLMLAAMPTGCDIGEDGEANVESSGADTETHASDTEPQAPDTETQAPDTVPGDDSTVHSDDTGRADSDSAATVISTDPLPVFVDDFPAAGFSERSVPVPTDAGLEDVSAPDTVVGDGTPESCTSAAVVNAVAGGGVITFDCGPEPVQILMEETAKIFNDTGPKIVIDGGGKVVLSGQGARRILYMNTCDEAQRWTTSHCQDQDHPQLTIQNLTFVNGNSKSETEYDGGGAVWVRGGRLKVVNSRFFKNVCADTGPDVGGGAIRVFSQYNGLPVYVVNSTFGGSAELANVCSNGGALSSIGVSWSIYNSYFGYNRAIGNGGNPAQSDTPGGGSGGAIYNDGNEMTLSVYGSLIEFNEVNAYGASIFFVSNNHTGNIYIEDSISQNNIDGSWYPAYPGISMHDDTPCDVVNSTVE